MPENRYPLFTPDPDFRAMSEKDLRDGLSRINRTLKELEKVTEHYFEEIETLQSLRKRFKAVWRARPGRKFHDLAARKKREKDRKRDNGHYYFGL